MRRSRLKEWSQLIQMQVSVAFIAINNYLLLFQNSLLPCLAWGLNPCRKREFCTTCNRILGSREEIKGEGGGFHTQKTWHRALNYL